MKMLQIEKRIPAVGEYDVVVCGGGPAGWVAAVSAARCGKRVALIERLGFFGGTATGCAVPARNLRRFCGAVRSVGRGVGHRGCSAKLQRLSRAGL